MAEDGGRIFREARIAGVCKHLPGDPKPGYITPWDELPKWQQETDADIFETIERTV
ncbi:MULTISPECIES: hypothetical protein [unclassified Kitasatospora]|uniref:hypothetical protein n=1 Tax=unclassified Kitasatospora TaxID=2633591 RepID=UPI0033E15191